MKNYYLRTVVLLLLLLGTAATAGAYSFQVNGIYYDIVGSASAGVVSVTYKDTNYNSYSGSITIPNTVTYNGNTYDVNSIGSNAFMNCTNLTSVTLPSQLDRISSYAFKGCTALTSITVPNRVTNIGIEAFANCTSLKTVILGTESTCSLTSIDRQAFDGCTALGTSDAKIYCRANTPPTIYTNTFTSATLSSAKLYVPGAKLSAYQAASYWKNFSSINAAFDFVVNGIYYHITGTNTVEVTWKTADYNSYSGSITIPSSVSYNGTTYNVTCIGNRAFRESSGLTHVYLPHSVTKIDQYAFSHCTGLTDIELNEVTYIGNDAFYNTGLTAVAIPSTVTYLGAEAFCNCASLYTVFIPNGITTIRYRTFQKCTSLWNIEIPNTVTTIDHSAFRWCTDLKRVMLGSDISCELTSIGNYAFEGCTALGNSDGSGSITCMALTPPTVSENTFGELNLTWGTNSISAIERYAMLITPYSAMRTYNTSDSRWKYFFNDQNPRWEFISGSYHYIVSGENTAYITHYGTTVNDATVSYNQSNITSRTLPTSVTFNNKTYTVNGIYGAFYGCTALRSVTIPNTYTYIGWKAFDGCTNLSSADLPESVTVVDVLAFHNTALTDIVIPSQVTEVGIGAYANDGTSPITRVTCLATTPPYVYQVINKGGQLNSWGEYDVFNSETYNSAPLCVPPGCKSAYQEAYDWEDFRTIYEMGYDFEVNGIYYKIADSNTVRVTYRDATHKCYSGNVTVPSTVTYNGTTYNVTAIGDYAFYNCPDLTGITLPNTITRIYVSAFQACTGLTSITIPNSVQYIFAYAFKGCTNLKTVKLGTDINCRLNSIALSAFENCTALGNSNGSGSITCMALTPPVLGDDVFTSETLQNAKFYMPYSAYQTYRGSNSGKWRNFVYSYPRWEFYSAPYYYVISGDNTAYITHGGADVDHPVVTYNTSGSRTLPTSVTFSGKTYAINGLYGAFYGCTNLSGVTIPETYAFIGPQSFDGCTGLNNNNVTIPEGVTSIEWKAFFNTGLTKVVIPSTVTWLGFGAFANSGTSPVTQVISLATTPPEVFEVINKNDNSTRAWYEYNVFNNETYTSAPLYVPAGCKSAYQAAHDWKNFTHIYELTNEAYAVVSNDTILTFYCDANKSTRPGQKYSLNEGEEYPGWYNDYLSYDITKVIFDPSFANARPTTTYCWFAEMYDLTSIEGIEYLNMSEVTNMSGMFWECESLTHVDMSGFDTRNVTDMSSMFAECYELSGIDVSGFDTQNVTNMGGMFNDCNNLAFVDVSHFNTAKVTNMFAMFAGCAVTSLDLSRFDTREVTNMAYMFSYCTSLETIYVGNGWSTENVEYSGDMFYSCTSIVGGMGTTYDTSNPKDKTYAHIDEGPSNPGYMTLGTIIGDVNGDGTVSISDVTGMIDYLLGGADINVDAADVNGDGIVSIGDVTALIDRLLSGN